MAGELAKAYVQIVPSARGIASGISQELGGEAQKSGDSFGKTLVGTIKNVIAAAGIGSALKEALNEGGALQQSLGGVETMFKDNADTVKAYAEEAYKTAGVSANGYMEQVTSFSASLLQSMGGDTKAAAETAHMAMVDMSDNANKFGTDIQDIQHAYQGFAKQNYTMLDNLKLGYGGTKTEMERLLADAQKLTGVRYDIGNLNDVYSAIHAIQDEMDVTGTTAMEAATTFTGSLDSMKAAASNLLGHLALGDDIRPSLNALGDTVFTFLTGNLLPMVGNVLKSLPDILSGLGDMVVRGLNMAANDAGAIVQMGLTIVTGLARSLISGIPYLVEAGWNLLTAFGNALVSTDWKAVADGLIGGLSADLDRAAGEILGTNGNILASLLSAVSNGLPEVLGKGAEIVTSLADGAMKALPDLVSAVGDILDAALAFLFDNFPSVLEAGVELIGELAEGILANLPAILAAIGDVVSRLLNRLAESLPDFLRKGMDLIKQLATGLLNALPSLVSSAASALAQTLATIAAHLPQFLAQGIAMIGQLQSGVVRVIPELLSKFWEIIKNIASAFLQFDWGELGLNIVRGLKDGILAGAGAVVDAVKDIARDALNTVKRALKINSPSAVFRDEIGRFIPAGIAVGIEANTQPLQDAMGELSGMSLSSMEGVLRSGVAPGIPAARPVPAGDITIHVYAAPGQDERAIARMIKEELMMDYERAEAAL